MSITNAIGRVAEEAVTKLKVEGKRMGFPKQHMEISSLPILEYLIDRFAWVGPTLLVTSPCREKPPGANRFDAEAVDAVGNQGPLRGVLTALQNATTKWVVVTTVDMPGLESSQLCWLVQRLMAQSDLLGLMLQRTVDGNTEIEPFPFACRKETAEIIGKRLVEGRRSVHSPAVIPQFALESPPDDWSPLNWTNLNSPGDYQSFVRSLQG